MERSRRSGKPVPSPGEGSRHNILHQGEDNGQRNGSTSSRVNQDSTWEEWLQKVKAFYKHILASWQNTGTLKQLEERKENSLEIEVIQIKDKKTENKLAASGRMKTDIIAWEDVEVPPRSELLCSGKMKKPIQGKTLVCEPAGLISNGVQVAYSVVDNKSIIPVRVVNSPKRKIVIQKGQKIGLAISAEEKAEEPEQRNLIKKIDATNDRWIKN